MPNITIEENVRAALIANTSIMNGIASDRNNNKEVRISKFNPVGDKFPQITISYKDGKHDSAFPACEGELVITVWCQELKTEQPYAFLVAKRDLIVSLFNQQGSSFNDLPNSFRLLQMVARSTEPDYDDQLRLYYCEIIFDVNKSKDESFSANDAGDKPWV